MSLGFFSAEALPAGWFADEADVGGWVATEFMGLLAPVAAARLYWTRLQGAAIGAPPTALPWYHYQQMRRRAG